MEKKKAFVRAAGEGKVLNVLGHSATVKVQSADTGGEYFVFELISPPGQGVPPHVHRCEDEVFYVIQGEVEIWLGGETLLAGPGATVHFPRGIGHGFRNVGDTPSRTVFTVMPGANFELFFDDLAALPAGPPDPEAVAAVFCNYDLELLGTEAAESQPE